MSEREILFRGKRVDNGEWVEGGFTPSLNGKRFYIGNMFECEEIIPETRGEYTGLTDCNGTKIFEGDIVSFVDCWNTQLKGVVCWRSGSYDVDLSNNREDKACVRLYTAYACGAKIIGNIHDNPELLRGE